MTVDIYIKKCKRNLNDYGFVQTCKKGISYLFSKIYLQKSYCIYRRDLREELHPETLPEGIIFKNVGINNTEIIEQIENVEEWLQGQLVSNLTHGLCIAIIDGHDVVGFNLIAFKKAFIPLLNIRKRLSPDQAWSDQITIKKRYRNKGLAISLRHHVFEELYKRGIRRFYGGALTSNIASLKLAQKVGFRPFVNVHYLKIMNREYHIYRRIKHGIL